MRPTDTPLLLPEAPGEAAESFSAWTVRVRAAVAAVERLAEEARRKERLVRQLLRQPVPDAAAIGTLVIDLDACRSEIDRIRRIVSTAS